MRTNNPKNASVRSINRGDTNGEDGFSEEKSEEVDELTNPGEEGELDELPDVDGVDELDGPGELVELFDVGTKTVKFSVVIESTEVPVSLVATIFNL